MFIGHDRGRALLVGLEQVELVLVYVVHALELGTYVYRPRQGADADFKLFLKLIEQVEGVASLAVHLVDEDYHRGVAHAAHLHEFACLRLHTLGTVYHYYGGVYGGEGAVCVLGEVLVAWSVEDVDFVALVVELHDGGRHGYTALLLYVHPVGCR